MRVLQFTKRPAKKKCAPAKKKRAPAKKKRNKRSEAVDVKKLVSDHIESRKPATKNKRSEAAKLREARKKSLRTFIDCKFSPVYYTQQAVSRPWTGIKLRNARMAAGVSLRELSEATGIPKTTLWATENGRLWKEETHEAYAKFLKPILMKNPSVLIKISTGTKEHE